MSKFDTFEAYPDGSIDLANRALLTAWDSLAAFHDDLVLVGGLAIRHLTKPPADGLPGPVTLDVDFGIHIGVESGMYMSVREHLQSHGFAWTGKRFQREVDRLPVYIDLLTEVPGRQSGSVVVEDGLWVGVIPGVQRALDCYRTLAITGENMIGAAVTQHIKVAEVGPMLVLKLNAFGGPTGRKASKDAHDILYLALEYLDGPEAAIAAFAAERAAGNHAAEQAIACLRNDFATPDAQGPLACAAFRLNNRHRDPALRTESDQIRQLCVTLAHALIAGK